MLHPVVLAGGVGTRLWPMSRAALPKQFIKLFPDQPSLFTATLNRLDGVPALASPMVVCNEEHRFLVASELQNSHAGEGTILLEPVGRNTAPAIALAAMQALQHDADAVLLVLPADHVISDRAVFHRAIESAAKLADNQYLVTFGIVPGGPETGYGYIRKGEEISGGGGYRVAQFVEKPDETTAQFYIDDGGYLWNSGMFLFRADQYLEELEQYASDIYQSCASAFQSIAVDQDFCRIPLSEFESCRSDSIDYAVMEKTDRVAMIPLDAGWNDLGSWDALWGEENKDSANNVLHGDVLTVDAHGSYIRAQSRLVATLGLRDMVVVETPDTVLVADKARVQEVKELVEQLQSAKRKESEFHPLVYRPWGSFESLSQGAGYQVKHIIVNPGAAISLQRHQHRSEHWTVVRGDATVHCDGKDFALRENESTFIPQGSKHRLSNNGDIPVQIIEIQVGDYLGEDDIERFEDLYGR